MIKLPPHLKKRTIKITVLALFSLVFSALGTLSLYIAITNFLDGNLYMAATATGVLIPLFVYVVGLILQVLKLVSGRNYATPTTKLIPPLALGKLHPVIGHKKNFWVVPFDDSTYESVNKQEFYYWLLACHTRQKLGKGPVSQSHWVPTLGRRQLQARCHLLLMVDALSGAGPRRKAKLTATPWRIYSQVDYYFGGSLLTMFSKYLKINAKKLRKTT